MGYYMFTTKSIFPSNDSNLKEKIRNASSLEQNRILAFSKYLFIKCERVEFNKTGCRLDLLYQKYLNRIDLTFY